MTAPILCATTTCRAPLGPDPLTRITGEPICQACRDDAIQYARGIPGALLAKADQLDKADQREDAPTAASEPPGATEASTEGDRASWLGKMIRKVRSD